MLLAKLQPVLGPGSCDSGNNYVSRLISSKSCSFITSALQRIIQVTVIVISLGIDLLCYGCSVDLTTVPLAKNWFGLTQFERIDVINSKFYKQTQRNTPCFPLQAVLLEWDVLLPEMRAAKP